jgi:hypothetical protein
MVLASAGDAEILDFDRTALLGQIGSLDRGAVPCGQRADSSDASSGRAAQSGTYWEVTVQHQRDSGNMCPGEGGGGDPGVVGSVLRMGREGIGELDRRVSSDGDGADTASLFGAIRRNISPSAAEIHSRRRARSQHPHVSARGGVR